MGTLKDIMDSMNGRKWIEVTEGKFVDVLGTRYEIIEKDEMPEGIDGKVDFYAKEIRIYPPELLGNDNDTWDCRQMKYGQVLRHELVHAFLYESGLFGYCDDETLVDYFALQFPKIVEVMDELQVI